MSVDLSYDATNIDQNQLHDELIRASLIPDLVTAGEDIATSPNPSGGDDLVTITPLVLLSFPDGTVEASVDAVVAAHQPMARYDTTEQLARIARVREIARLKADYDEVLRMGEALTDFPSAIACLRKLVETLIRRDRATGLY